MRRSQLELPDTLDQMTIAVEAGLGFESAMAQAGRNGTGPLAEELVRTLQDIEMGRTRREAYEALGERISVEDLRRFTRAVTQADDQRHRGGRRAAHPGGRDAPQAAAAGRGEGDEDPGQGDLPAAALHPAGAVHRGDGPGSHGHRRDVQGM